MATQEGSNVNVIAVRGNFDDAQSAVKAIFADEEIKKIAEEKGEFLSSANSINIARLVPQVAYYVSAYIDIVKSGLIKDGETIDVSVPTGNFGDILAGWLAKKMGVPLGKLICASNRNRVLTDFFVTGVYDTRRPFYATTSPSMDILIASNLERLLCFSFGTEQTAAFMKSLKENGTFTLTPAQLDILEAEFGCSSCDDQSTAEIIKRYFDDFGYLLDTHTAAALMGASRDKCLVVSTASPYKFAPAVADALGMKEKTHEALSLYTGTQITAPLKDIYKKDIRFTRVVDKADIKKSLYLQ
jgi:threonine synthase